MHSQLAPALHDEEFTHREGASAPRDADGIADLIVNAILAGRLAAGQRLGEQQLAELFSISRTLVREALGRLSARGMVRVQPRRGWFVVEPSRDEAEAAFGARLAIESGLVGGLQQPLTRPALRKLKQHVVAERAAIRAGEPGRRSYMLGEFHVCLAECAGNPLLANILKDLTARTTLIASLYQSTHNAELSCREHVGIVAALEAGDHSLAAQRLRDHIRSVADHLGAAEPSAGSVASLRKRLFSDLIDPSPLRNQRTKENSR